MYMEVRKWPEENAGLLLDCFVVHADDSKLYDGLLLDYSVIRASDSKLYGAHKLLLRWTAELDLGRGVRMQFPLCIHMHSSIAHTHACMHMYTHIHTHTCMHAPVSYTHLTLPTKLSV